MVIKMSRLKRLAAPRMWPMERKRYKYVISLRAGPHSFRTALPLGVFIRDIAKHTETKKETRELMKNGVVKVDGIIRKDQSFPVGFMDVVSIGDDHYRVF